MYNEHHDLVNEFPAYRDQIQRLKMDNNYFSRLFAEYHDLDREVRRTEQGIETPSDTYTEVLKKRRLHLKDELYRMIKQA